MSRKLLVASLLVSGVGLALVFQIPGPPLVYARSVSEQVERPLRETKLRVRGYVVPGSLCRQADPCEYRFEMSDAPGPRATEEGPALPVRYPSCIVPDNFGCREPFELRVTIEGTQCATCHGLEATQLFVSCPEKYDMARRHGAKAREPIQDCKR